MSNIGEVPAGQKRKPQKIRSQMCFLFALTSLFVDYFPVFVLLFFSIIVTIDR